MGTVCSSSLLRRLVDLDVLDNKVAGVKTLGVGVGLGVLEQREEELGRLDGPSGTRDTELLSYNANPSDRVPSTELILSSPTLRASSGSAGIPPHRDGLLVTLDILEVGDGALELPAVDGLGRLTGILERDTEVGTARAGRLGGRDLGGCVADLLRWHEGDVSLGTSGCMTAPLGIDNLRSMQ